MEIKIRNLNVMDLDQIMEVEKTCFTLPWSKDSFMKELLNKLAYYHCAIVNDKVIGYMGMWKILDEGHITNVAVLPVYRNKGVATLLINRMIEVCKCSEINRVTLEVRQSNYVALNLYEKFGFKSMGIRPNYYQKPPEDAIIMWKIII